MADEDIHTVDELNALLPATLPGLLGVVVTEHERGRLVGRLTVRPEPLADTACGLATRALLPAGSAGFTTLELKSNFLSTAREGELQAVATAAHAGRTTQVWDAVVTCGGRTLALFRCTQSVLWPR